MRRATIILFFALSTANATTCTLSALHWVVSDWSTAIQGTWLTVGNGPSGAFRESSDNEVADLSALGTLESWRVAVPSLTVTYKVDQSLNWDGFEASLATFQIRATYTCDDATTQYYYPPFSGSALTDNTGHSWAYIGSGATGGTASGVMFHSRSLSDNFSIVTTGSFGPVPLTLPSPPTPTPPQCCTTVRSHAVRNAAVR